MALEKARVIIVGGGFGGLTAAKGLRREAVEVVVVDRHNHHLFQPLLYQVATAALPGGDIASPIRWILRRQRNTRVVLGEVVRVDRSRRIVALADGSEEPYDYLVLAPGSSTHYFDHPEWEARVGGLKDLQDAYRIRDRILLAFEHAERETDPRLQEKLLTFVVIGGGPTGLELAGALADIARGFLVHDFRRIDPRLARILLVEGGSRILPSFPESLSTAAQHALERLGVEVRTGCRVEDVRDDRVQLDGAWFPAGTVLWAAGVRPSALGQALEVPLDRLGRVPVTPDLSLPADPRVFVAGDLAACLENGKPLPGLAAVAQQEGAQAAANIRADLRGQPRKTFHYVDRGNMATIGRFAAIADFSHSGVRLWGGLAWLAWLFVHLLLLISFGSFRIT